MATPQPPQDDHDTTMADLSTLSTTASKSQKSQELFTCTISKPCYAYAHLELATSGSLTSTSTSAPTPEDSAAPLDALQVRAYCTSALQRLLGATGAAIPVDILRVTARACWVRVPREDLAAFAAAIAAWPGTVRDDGTPAVLHVRAAGNWLGSLLGRGEQRELWDG